MVCAVVVCATGALCLAGASKALAGGWSVQPTPNLPGAPNGQLMRVSCASPTACTAVGIYAAGPAVPTVVERWNGTRWSIQPTPKPSRMGSIGLTGVSCALKSSCIAVGSIGSGGW